MNVPVPALNLPKSQFEQTFAKQKQVKNTFGSEPSSSEDDDGSSSSPDKITVERRVDPRKQLSTIV